MTASITQPTQEGDYYELPYRVFADHGLGDPPVEIPVQKHIANASSFLAANRLRFARLRFCDGPIEAASVAEESEFPYRNRYGPLTDDLHDRWGYRFRDPGDGVVKSVWLERLGPRVDFLNESTFRSLVFVSEIPQRKWEDLQPQHEALEETPVDSTETDHETSKAKGAEEKGASEGSEAA